MTTTEAIRARRSIRAFRKDRPISPEQLHLLLEAAMLAPSACNSRPWEFVVVQQRETLDQIAAVHPYAKMLQTAPLAVIVCARPQAEGGPAEGYFPQDCAAATQNLLLQAVELGLGACWCGVYPREERMAELRGLLGIESVPFNVIAVGVPAEAPPARGRYEEARVTLL